MAAAMGAGSRTAYKETRETTFRTCARRLIDQAGAPEQNRPAVRALAARKFGPGRACVRRKTCLRIASRFVRYSVCRKKLHGMFFLQSVCCDSCGATPTTWPSTPAMVRNRVGCCWRWSRPATSWDFRMGWDGANRHGTICHGRNTLGTGVFFCCARPMPGKLTEPTHRPTYGCPSRSFSRRGRRSAPFSVSQHSSPGHNP